MTVPTVERGLWLVAFCSMEIAGLEALDQIDIGFSINCKTAAHTPTTIHISPLTFCA